MIESLKVIKGNNPKRFCLLCTLERPNLVAVRVKGIYIPYYLCYGCLATSVDEQFAHFNHNLNEITECNSCSCFVKDYFLYMGYWRVCQDCCIASAEKIVSFLESL